MKIEPIVRQVLKEIPPFLTANNLDALDRPKTIFARERERERERER